MAICKDNNVIMWGSNKEGFMTYFDSNKEKYALKDFAKVEKLTINIANDIFENSGTITEVFINCKLPI